MNKNHENRHTDDPLNLKGFIFEIANQGFEEEHSDRLLKSSVELGIEKVTKNHSNSPKSKLANEPLLATSQGKCQKIQG
jgi:hypothetical protein